MPTVKVPTRYGAISANYSFMKHPEGSPKLAILFPGMGYTLDAPVMWYTAKAAFTSGCDVIGVEYGYQANRTELNFDDLGHLVDEAAGALENAVSEQYSNIVFIGKSLGTIVQTEVLKKVSFSVRNHVFLTPLRRIISEIQQSENALVIVGGNDEAFESSDVVQISSLSNIKVHVVPNADHVLETEDYTNSVDILKETAILCGQFCKELL